MREYLDKVIKADQCAQYVDDIGIAANDVDHLMTTLRATFRCIQEAGLKLTMHKCHFGAKEIDFLGRTITPQGVKPQKQNVQNFLEKTKFPKSKKALQRYLGFLNYYRNYVPRLSERLAPFYKMLKSDEKVLVSKELVQRFEEINRALDKCCDLALQQPIPNKQIALMTDASFGAAGYAVLIEDDPSQKFTSLRKSYAPVAYGSKTFTPAQIKMSIYAKEFLAIYFAFKEFGHIFWGAPKPVIILTDNKAVTKSMYNPQGCRKKNKSSTPMTTMRQRNSFGQEKKQSGKIQQLMSPLSLYKLYQQIWSSNTPTYKSD